MPTRHPPTIHDVRVAPLTQVEDERGKVMHMLRSDSPAFAGFGEIYFSTVHPGAVKAWRRHRRMVLNYAVVSGAIKLALYDDRDDSPTLGVVQELIVGDQNYCLVTIPAMIWVGFKGISAVTAIVANCASLPHDGGEIERRPASDAQIPYRWD